MVALQELFAFFESVAPKALAEDYDNVGLLVEGDAEEIDTLILALDADENTVCEAEKAGAQLILTHHPIMFRPVNKLTEEEGGQRTIRRLLQKGIGLFAMHTNFDSAEGGLCDAFLDSFGTFSERTSFAGTADGIGRIGRLEKPCTLAELLARGKKAFSPDNEIRYVGNRDSVVETVAVCNGGGGDMLYDAYALGAQVYISGDFKHHHARFAVENNISLIQIDHYDAEVGFCNLMKKRLEVAFGDALKVIIANNEKSPWKSF
ncbi:MAG: Nif3-like dinuclear metal center hexameric protein [Clostridia bacterium]|nr:Nif3-like dinuclear metal center hexameric protein [Clostridia bacterium]